ncbi:hypothetical protein L6164_017834 [Bauhinia variegata]|uniref:Uncharacterized protein n=1 Tax=Bauhinia variegata TaxID=167791 RepID=A0ACB9N9X2_BAUVA|nr:hypothetical protein L6164_017834 [Bauhinia variegata]
MNNAQNPKERSDSNWRRRCRTKVEILKAKFSNAREIHIQEILFRGINMMSFGLYEAVRKGDPDDFVEELEKSSLEKKVPLNEILDQVVGSAGESLLHVAAHFGREKIVELIAGQFPDLLLKRNVKGDTPLHVAARAKNSNVIMVILSQYAVAQRSKSMVMGGERITRMSNEYGNTPLHEAVNRNHVNGVVLIYLADKSMIHCLNKSRKSPLYLAVLTSNMEILHLLLQTPFPEDMPLLSCSDENSMPPPLSHPLLSSCHGNSPLHSAINVRKSDLIEEILRKGSELMYVRDEDGGSPLHYAASTGYVEGVRILLRKFTAFSAEWNTKGQCPIHLACKSGHVEVVKEFLQQEWPVATSLLNKKGENILHVAANNGKENVVKFLLRSSKIDKSIINGKDNDGNTPLHLASKHFYPEILFSLTQDERTVLNIQNNKGLTALDMFLVHSEVPRTVQEKLSHWILFTSGGDQTEEGRRILRGHQETPKVDWIKDRVNTVALVAMLIATMTFAAGLLVPVPASVSSSGETDEYKTQCAAVSINRTMFQVYTICNAVATYSSTAASFILLWTQADNYHLVRQVYKFALHLVSMAILAMTVAFMTAVRLNLKNASCLANAITIIGIIFLSFIFVVFCLLAFPVRYHSSFAPLHYFSHIALKIWVTIYGRYSKFIDQDHYSEKLKYKGKQKDLSHRDAVDDPY